MTDKLKSLIGKECYFKDWNENFNHATITRVDVFVHKSGVGMKLHVKPRKGTRVHDDAFNLFNYEHMLSNATTAFLSIEEYNKYHTEE